MDRIVLVWYDSEHFRSPALCERGGHPCELFNSKHKTRRPARRKVQADRGLTLCSPKAVGACRFICGQHPLNETSGLRSRRRMVSIQYREVMKWSAPPYRWKCGLVDRKSTTAPCRGKRFLPHIGLVGWLGLLVSGELSFSLVVFFLGCGLQDRGCRVSQLVRCLSLTDSIILLDASHSLTGVRQDGVKV